MDWFPCDRDLRHERVNQLLALEKVRGVIRGLQTSTMELLAKKSQIVTLKTLTISQKGPSQMLEWNQNVPLQVNTTQFLKFQRRYLPDASRDGIILINYLNLMFRSVNCVSSRRPLLKQLSKVSVRCRSSEHLSRVASEV